MNKKAIDAYDALCVAMEKLRDLDEVDARSVAISLDGWRSGRLGPTYKAVAQELIPFLSLPSRTLSLESFGTPRRHGPTIKDFKESNDKLLMETLENFKWPPEGK